MAQKIIIKKSTVVAKAPTDAQLDVGELAVNTADSVLYTKHSDGSIKRLSPTMAERTKIADSVSSSDARLTDSREWSEATVTQAEAEAGTASTRRAWTAQRVRQAINAWWQLVTSGFGRNLVSATNEQAARTILQLGNAATHSYGAAANTIAQGNDTRIVNASQNGHTHPWAQVTGAPATATRWPTFNEVTGKPTTYAPSGHTHPHTQVTGLGTAATRNVGTGSGNVMEVGAGGLLTKSGRPFSSPTSDNNNAGFYRGYKAGATTAEGWPVNLPHLDYTSVVIGNSAANTSVLFFNTRTAQAYLYCKREGIYDGWVELLSNKNLRTTTGQSPQYPMTQKAVTDAINARGFADASGVLTATSGALSNDMSSFLSQTTKATMRSNLGVPQLNASATAQGGLKARLAGTTLYLSNNGTNP